MKQYTSGTLRLACALVLASITFALVVPTTFGQAQQGPPQQCQNDRDCNNNQICFQNVCIVPAPPRPPVISPFFNQLPLSGFGIEQVSGRLTIQRMVINILAVTAGSIVLLCTAIFIAGAYLFAISAGDEQRKSLGKDLMIGAIVGIAIVIGAKGILDMIYFFVYGV